MGGGGQPRADAERRLLGAVRVRQGRVGRPLERLRGVKPGYVRRFSKTERTVHWVNALGFFFLLATGLILYIPRLSIEVGRRQFIQEIHFWGGVGWVASLLIVAVLGDRSGLLRTARELDVFER